MAYSAKESAEIYYRYWVFPEKTKKFDFSSDPLEVRDEIVAEMNPDDYFPPEWIKLTTESIKGMENQENP